MIFLTHKQLLSAFQQRFDQLLTAIADLGASLREGQENLASDLKGLRGSTDSTRVPGLPVTVSASTHADDLMRQILLRIQAYEDRLDEVDGLKARLLAAESSLQAAQQAERALSDAYRHDASRSTLDGAANLAGQLRERSNAVSGALSTVLLGYADHLDDVIKRLQDVSRSSSLNALVSVGLKVIAAPSPIGERRVELSDRAEACYARTALLEELARLADYLNSVTGVRPIEPVPMMDAYDPDLHCDDTDGFIPTTDPRLVNLVGRLSGIGFRKDGEVLVKASVGRFALPASDTGSPVRRPLSERNL